LENYANVAYRDLNFKENGIAMKSELGLKFEELAKVIFLGFNAR
jgi:hypothetical protein